MTSAALSTPTDQGTATAVAPASPTPAPATPATPAVEQKGEAPKPAPETPKQQTAADKVLDALKPAESKEGEQKPAAPDKYEAWKLPDGVKLSEKVDAEFTTLARKAGLSQADAQASLEKLVAANDEQVQTGLRSQVEQWGEQLMADPDLGGDKFEKHTAPLMQKAITAFDPNGEFAALLANGLGVHPAAARFLAAVGASVSPHTNLVVGSGFKPPTAKTDAELFYPHQTRQLGL
jgi:hypothetical protein